MFLCTKLFLRQRSFGSGFIPLFPPLRKAFEEIIIQQIANFQQQIRINPSAVEDFVGVLSGATKLCSQPSDAAPLPCQFCLDEFPYVRFFFHCVCLSGSLARWANKMGGTIFTYPS